MAEKNDMSGAQAALTLIGLVLFAWFFLGRSVGQPAAEAPEQAESRAIDEAVNKYQIAKRSGNPIDACTTAGLVTAAYQRAKDEAGYAAWKKTESADCGALGLPDR
jgi:hypothetical protein